MSDFLLEEEIGIESLDNDHKKLISILDQLLSIQNCNLKQYHINHVFDELEAYYKLYFLREEKLLFQIGYQRLEEYRESNLAFTNKIIHLKSQWVSGAYSAEVVRNKISFFIQQWLIKHHIDKKLDYVSAIYGYKNLNQYKCQKESQKPWLRSYASKLSQYLFLSHRVFITTLLPVVAVFFLCLVILKEYYQEYQNINVVLGLNRVINEVNIVSHSLQLERGLSTGTLNKDSKVFVEKLLEHRKNTDRKIKHFLWLLEQENYKGIRSNISQYLGSVRNTLASLPEYRKNLDTQVVDPSKTYQRYSKLIESLLSVSEHLIHANVSSTYVNDIFAINTILRYKEFMGQIRAIGLKAINNSENNISENIEIAFLFGKQNNTLSTFINSADIKQKSICDNFCNKGEQQKKIVRFYQKIINIDDKNAQMIEWFKVMSDEVDQLDKVLKALISEFDETIYDRRDQLKLDTYLIILYSSLVLLGAIFFSRVLNYSIISPIRKLTFALNDLSTGQNNIRFEQNPRKDDIGSMQLAFEKLRTKLLQGDMYKITVSQQKEELQYRKSQQDYFQQLASKDALTGAFNRHYFNERLQEEITNFTLHGKALSILLLDIDHFKQINDTYGHGAGDEMLILFYQTCMHTVRSSDAVARIGGEEFVIVMPDTELNDAVIFAERLCNRVANLDINLEGRRMSMTVSIGVSQYGVDITSSDKFLEKTDKLLYQAKKSGRNKVVFS